MLLNTCSLGLSKASFFTAWSAKIPPNPAFCCHRPRQPLTRCASPVMPCDPQALLAAAARLNPNP